MCACVCAQSCLTLCDLVDCSLPDSSVHGLFQARILKLAAISYSMGSSPPRDQTPVSCVSCIGRQILYHSAPWEVQNTGVGSVSLLQGILAWVAISYPKRFSQPLGSNLHFLCLLVLVGGFFTISSTQEALTCVELQSLWL